ncbi:MAG TPA: hypothetical protein EYH54_01730 [Nautiliaceae bacterium]|nr:hypothetical protein [Nautiliaceae bacterium]
MKTKKSELDKKISLGVAIFLILILVSIGIYNYEKQVDYNAYHKFFEVISFTVEGLVSALVKALCAINLCPGASTWGVIIALALFVIIALWISKDESKKSDNKKEKKKEEKKEKNE